MLTPRSPHQDFELAVAALALDAIDARDRPALDAHLATCDACRADLADMRRASLVLAESITPVTPADGLKARVLARALGDSRGVATPPSSRELAGPRRSFGAMPGWLAVAAALVLAAAGAAYGVWVRQEVLALRVTVAQSAARETELNRALTEIRRDATTTSATLAVLSAPDLVRVDLAGQPGAAGAAGRAFWSRSRGVLFTAQGLPALPADRVYQLWVVTPAAPVSAGLLTISATGATSVVSSLPAGVGSLVAVAVTIEPAGGVPAPTGPKVLIGAF